MLTTSTDTFDVFLSHNGTDKPAIRDIKQRLLNRGFSCWLDVDEIPPGTSWMEGLEEGIKQSRSTAILIGAEGMRPWVIVEMQAALQLAVQKGQAVIPVILPGVIGQPELPLFLSGRHWVDLRPVITEENLDALVWGITGNRSENPTASEGTATTSPGGAAQRRFSGMTKLQFCDRLGHDWPRLADILEIPEHQVHKFARGEEARAIWAWLEFRNRLNSLIPALKEIGRDDLAAIFL